MSWREQRGGARGRQRKSRADPYSSEVPKVCQVVSLARVPVADAGPAARESGQH